VLCRCYQKRAYNQRVASQLTYQGERFGTAVSCMDGRCLDAVQYLLKSRYGVHHVDTITEPGMVGRLSARDERVVDSARRCLQISVHTHGSRFVAVVGHHDCTGNPVNLKLHLDQIRRSCEIVAEWEFNVQIIGLYINDLWQAEEICSIPAPVASV
jgi:hypothetical protein